MSLQVWKYSLLAHKGEENIITVPKGGRVVHVGSQKGITCLWAEVDPEALQEVHRFFVYGTGWDIPPNMRYVGTTLVELFVWHVYEQE